MYLKRNEPSQSGLLSNMYMSLMKNQYSYSRLLSTENSIIMIMVIHSNWQSIIYEILKVIINQLIEYIHINFIIARSPSIKVIIIKIII